MKAIFYPLTVFILLSVFSCHEKGNSTAGGSPISAATPVTITSPDTAAIQEEVSFTARSSFLLKSTAKANTNGYIVSSSIHLGDVVRQGQVIFTLKTKEAESLGNTINNLDPTFNFSGINHVRSPANGYVTQLNHQNGDYVQDGELLAEIANQNSFGFILNLPYEYNRLFSKNKAVNLILPDSTVLQGFITQVMPSLDSASQTQQVLIKVPGASAIPANLIAQVTLVKNSSKNPSLPKEAVLSDPSQQNFWVMKIINDSTAIKIPIQKGIESDARVEILSPIFTLQDKILLTGNYGLRDTAKVIIMHNQGAKE